LEAASFIAGALFLAAYQRLSIIVDFLSILNLSVRNN